MNFLLCSLSLLSVSSLLIFLTAPLKKISGYLFLASLTAGCLGGLIASLSVLVSPLAISYRLNFRMPAGEFYIGMDPLSAFFLLVIVIVLFLAGIYSYGYLKDYGEKNLSLHFAIYQVLLISMMLVVIAKNAVLFLAAWEMMAVASYFLIIFYDEKESVRKAGYLYLIATHTGTFCLGIMFLLMAHHSGSMSFDQMTIPYPLPLSGLLFVLGILGFGVKAGFIPLHIWLPHAHPEAPSHISAVLSGVMIKMGIYGLMRIILIVNNFPEWCAAALILIGAISGVGGVLYALGQHEIKKLLAYHSIENIGIITLGMGIGLGGQIYHNEPVAVIGYAGALLHVFNHAIFKGLLFLSAGSVIRAVHTGEIDHLGGLLKVIPWTGYLFLIGSLSICGLPLFNGFISEWLVYRALFEGMFHFKVGALLFSGLAVVSLALIGGLCAACFAKAFGAIFLGNSRSANIIQSIEDSLFIRVPMAALGVICVWVGLFPRAMVSFALEAASTIPSVQISPIVKDTVIVFLLMAVPVLFVLIAIIAILIIFKRSAMKLLPIERAHTWGCGYSLPTARMQYTASSFAEPILRIFSRVMGYRVKGKPKGYFPKEGEIASQVREASEDFIFQPVFKFIKALSASLKIIQCGYTQVYLLYIFVFLLALLIWKMV